MLGVSDERDPRIKILYVQTTSPRTLLSWFSFSRNRFVVTVFFVGILVLVLNLRNKMANLFNAITANSFGTVYGGLDR